MLLARKDIGEAKVGPSVRPRIHARAKDFLKNKDLIFSLIEQYGSPLNIVFPQNLDDNIRDFEAVYAKHRLKGRKYYVTKPCKARSLMREAKQYDLGIDVSSSGSLNEALRLEWEASRIVANGPKNAQYLKKAVESGVLINADNIEELKSIADLSRASGVKTKVGVRLCDFHSASASFTPHDNTFGIRLKHLDWVLPFLSENKACLEFQGFSFHIAGDNTELKSVAIENTLTATFTAIKRGLSPKSINIGGGFPIMYADICQEWHGYVEHLKSTMLNQSSSEIWDGGTLGYRLQNGVLAGGPSLIDHAPFRAKGESLDHLVSQRLPSFGNAVIADVVRDSLLGLDIEAGKAMLDQCGLTLGQVMFTKESSFGETLVGLDMNRTNIQAAEQKILTSPIVIYQDEEKNDLCDNGVLYMGNLCLSYDLLQYNKTYPDYIPRAGDAVAFMNTAAYAMDFSESESLMQPLAKKVAVVTDGQTWKYFLDEEYQPSTGR